MPSWIRGSSGLCCWQLCLVRLGSVRALPPWQLSVEFGPVALHQLSCRVQLPAGRYYAISMQRRHVRFQLEQSDVCRL